jgi:hypothetical protein
MMQTPSAQNLPVSVEKSAGMDYNRFVYILLPRVVAARQQFFPFIIAQNVSFGQGLQATRRHIHKKGRSKCQKKHCRTP